MKSFPMDTNDAVSMTQTQHVSQVDTEFLPEKDIPTDGVLREEIRYQLGKYVEFGSCLRHHLYSSGMIS